MKFQRARKDNPTDLGPAKTALYSTSDLGVSAVLLSSNFKLIRFDNSDQRRVVFYFQDEPSLRETVADYWDDRLKVRALTFFNNMKALKARIHAR